MKASSRPALNTDQIHGVWGPRPQWGPGAKPLAFLTYPGPTTPSHITAVRMRAARAAMRILKPATLKVSTTV